ncbi:hypothetical protein DPMN_019668 [Dreissena polymorpha]|uniref:Uncharacterized protein n=1 Tax=Dreissena polymorpha TaxID=45954 RepID=A0A9D4NFF0_DREPO|nr:hypothetical protein DPMN_019668 [Dreissena polymorpha]
MGVLGYGASWAKFTLSIRDTFLGCPKVSLSVHKGFILTSSSPVSGCSHYQTLHINRIPDIKAFFFKHLHQQQSSSRVTGISMVWNPPSLNIITAHEPVAVIISRFWYIHGAGPSVCKDHAERTSDAV